MNLRRFSIAHRILASVCLFSLPLAVLFYFNIDQLSERVAFARGELNGDRFQSPAIQFIKTLIDYRAASLAGALETAALKQNVDALAVELRAADRDLGSGLGFTQAALRESGMESSGAAAVLSRWESLRSFAQADSKPASDCYDELVTDLRGWVSHAGDTSNLTLDPEMDSYYLADVTSVTIAQTLNRIGATKVSFERLLKTGRLSASDRTALAVIAAELKDSDFDRITGDLDTAVKENARSARGVSPSLKAGIEPAVAQYKNSVQALIDVLNSLGQGGKIDAAQFHLTVDRASQASLDLWRVTLHELGVVLEMRIGGFARYRLKLILLTCVALGLATLVLIVTVRGVTNPLKAAVFHLQHVARGDLSRDLPSELLDRGDEIGSLAESMRTMSRQLREMIVEISKGVGDLSSTANLLRGKSTAMAAESSSAFDKAHSVAAATEQMSCNVVSVAASMEQTTVNLSHVSDATGQVTLTVNEIAGSTEKARRIAEQANQQALCVTEKIRLLSSAAEAIGKIAETITEISSQTNLLALNATIEAARAGVAGKGFAVVANEIKALAQQTAGATEDVKSRIADVQNSTSGGIVEIEKVSSIIAEVNDIVSLIAAAIEEQSITTKDIARNIAEASIGVNEANARIAESSQVSKEIARDIVAVDHAASEMADGSRHVGSGAEEVSRISDQLRQMVGRFQV